MRLWTIHPALLDTPHLNAVWREGLGAYTSLKAWVEGKPKGYSNHPQLERFKDREFPLDTLAYYIKFVYYESLQRDFNYSKTKLPPCNEDAMKEIVSNPIVVSVGQLKYEYALLCTKGVTLPPTVYEHPLFSIDRANFDPEPWERVRDDVQNSIFLGTDGEAERLAKAERNEQKWDETWYKEYYDELYDNYGLNRRR